MYKLLPHRRSMLSPNLTDKRSKEETIAVGTRIVECDGSGFHIVSPDIGNAHKLVLNKNNVGHLRRLMKFCQAGIKGPSNRRNHGASIIKKRGYCNEKCQRATFFQPNGSNATMSTQPSSLFDRLEVDIENVHNYEEHTRDDLLESERKKLRINESSDSIKEDSAPTPDHKMRRKVARYVLTSLLTDEDDTIGPIENKDKYEQSQVDYKRNDPIQKFDRYSVQRQGSCEDSIFDGIGDDALAVDTEPAIDDKQNRNTLIMNAAAATVRYCSVIEYIACFSTSTNRWCQRSPESHVVAWDDTVVLSELSY